MKKTLKIAIYTIALNESKFVDSFMDCFEGKDKVPIYVTDTGSTDDTVEKLRARGAIVNEIKLSPWRFDVARNISLSFVPADIDVCVCIDLDEVLSKGWKKEVLNCFSKNNINQLKYPYVWNTLEDGSDGIKFYYEKIHSRDGFRWVKPVHEILEYSGTTPLSSMTCDNFILRHYPDPTKSRGSYLPLLEMSVKEDPKDDRNSHYYGRELMYYGQNEAAIKELIRHLSLEKSTWKAERSASMRYISKCYSNLNNIPEAKCWALKACAEEPSVREPWVNLGEILWKCQDFLGAFYAMKQAILIKNHPMNYLNDPKAWGNFPHDIAGVCAYQIGLYQEALDQMNIALELNPNDERIKNNIKFTIEKLNSK